VVAHAHFGLGMLYAGIGRRELAVAELGAAAELYRDMDMPSWLERSETALQFRVPR